MPEIQFVCPHCGGTSFDKNPLFFECCDCGTRYVGGVDGKLQKTELYGHGDGTRGRGASDVDYAGLDQENSANVYVQQNINNGTIYVQQNVGVGISRRKRWAAFFLCLFFGVFGVHYFYLGRWGMGILFFLTVGFLGLGWVFDLLRILFVGIRDIDGNYAV